MSGLEGPEAGRERMVDEDTGITWVDFTDIIRNAAAGESAIDHACPLGKRKKDFLDFRRFSVGQGAIDIIHDSDDVHDI